MCLIFFSQDILLWSTKVILLANTILKCTTGSPFWLYRRPVSSGAHEVLMAMFLGVGFSDLCKEIKYMQNFCLASTQTA